MPPVGQYGLLTWGRQSRRRASNLAGLLPWAARLGAGLPPGLPATRLCEVAKSLRAGYQPVPKRAPTFGCGCAALRFLAGVVLVAACFAQPRPDPYQEGIRLLRNQ